MESNKRSDNSQGKNGRRPKNLSRLSRHPTTLADITGYVAFFYNTDAHKDRLLPSHDALKSLVLGKEGFAWTSICTKELVELEQASGFAYDQVNSFYRLSFNSKVFATGETTMHANGCKSISFCKCPKEKPHSTPLLFDLTEDDSAPPAVGVSDYLRVIGDGLAEVGSDAFVPAGLYLSPTENSEDESVGSSGK
jgi:hypothetical protein